MAVMSPRTIETTYENGLLRPLEPMQDSADQVYLVMGLRIDAFRSKLRPQPAIALRGRYRGYLSSADEFALGKQAGKVLER